MKTDVWLKRALPTKGNPHPTLPSTPFILQGKRAASNGTVLYVAADTPTESDMPLIRHEDKMIELLTRPLPSSAEVTTDPLLHAAKAAKAVAANVLRLTLGGSVLVYAKGLDASTSWELTDGSRWEPCKAGKSTTIHCSRSGPNAEVALSPKLLYNALSGMGEMITVEAETDLVRINDGDRIAVIAAMHMP